MTANAREMERVPDGFYTPIYDDITIKRIEKEFSRLHAREYDYALGHIVFNSCTVKVNCGASVAPVDEHYLDHAGATLYSETQIKSVSNDMLTSLYANPHSTGVAGNLTHEIVERTRYRLLDHFHASPEEYSLVFTSGATAALKNIAETFRFGDVESSARAESGNFVYLQDNHTSVLGMRDLVSQRGAKVACLSHRRAFEIFAESSSSRAHSFSEKTTNSLFVYSAQCNFTGLKYPLEWIRKVQNGILDGKTANENSERWYVLLDAASFVGTNDLDLSIFKPDFVALSFYKMFGYPTGTGALLVRKSSSRVLEKIYYGGGTVKLAMSLENFHVKRDVLHERFEDGTLPFLALISLQHGLDAMSMVPLDDISRHVFSLARYLHHSLRRLRHRNDKPVVRIYRDTSYEDRDTQGGVVTFNLLRWTGEYVGYTEVTHMAAIFKIHLRTGCLCNPGACQRQLGLSSSDVMGNYDAGYTCGGSRDLIDGKPTGAVRVSFGYMSTRENVEALLRMIEKCFIDGPEVQRVRSTNLRDTLGTKLSSGLPKITVRNSVTGRDDLVANNNSANVKKSDENVVYDIGKDRISRSIKVDGKFELSRLFIYPIKSCAPYEITDSWLLGERGLLYDREWMIVTSAGVCLSQKQHVKLCLLKPQICRRKNTLVLNYPGMPSAQIPLDLESQDTINRDLCRSRVCGHRVEGIDCGGEISEWLSLALGRPSLRLIRQSNVKNFAKDSSKPELSFSSQAQYLLINEASVQWIIEKLPENSDCLPETILHRFRGNMVLRGTTPFCETSWSRVQIGKHKFQVDGPCTRCQMVCIDQTTGIKTVEPLRLIAEEFGGKMRFGVYLSRQRGEPAVISIGDSITCI